MEWLREVNQMPQWLVVDVTLHWVWANNPREPPSRRKKKKKSDRGDTNQNRKEGERKRDGARGKAKGCWLDWSWVVSAA